jgi:hypothetical protein
MAGPPNNVPTISTAAPVRNNGTGENMRFTGDQPFDADYTTSKRETEEVSGMTTPQDALGRDSDGVTDDMALDAHFDDCLTCALGDDDCGAVSRLVELEAMNLRVYLIERARREA